MGILRSDRVSGLGGANAINGSVFFGTSDLQSNNQNLIVSNTSELDIGSGNFTIEYWFNCGNTSSGEYSTSVATSEYNGSSSNTAFTIYHYVQGIRIFNRISGGYSSIFNTSSSWTPDSWHHFAWVREGTGSSENKVYIDGTLIGGSFTNAANYTSGQHWLIGANFYTGSDGYGKNPEYGFNGHISNVRVSNVARYTANFTVPTTRYEKDANTILLACQSPGNILKEETGKIITTYGANTNTAPPMASHFAPDVGEDYGTTFADNTVFDTLSYMVPPGGRTDQRGRGRGVFAGGYTSAPSDAAVKRIYYIQIDSMGTSAEFGDTNKAAAWGQSGCSSSTRGLITGGTNPANLNTIDYITIATTSNALDFGDLNVQHGYTASCSNNTRGLTGGGRGNSPTQRLAQIDYNTIATLGNGQDFGDLTQSRMGLGAVASSTRAVFTGGNGSPADPSTVYNIIDYVEFATTGNATDFGDMTDEHTYHGSCSSSTRGIIYGGVTSYGPSVTTNIIEYVTIASTGNGTDFGDVRDDGAHAHGTSNGIRGVFAGGVNPYRNSIDFITITTTGNGVDWGDLPDSNGSYAYAAGLSDSHGGLS